MPTSPPGLDDQDVFLKDPPPREVSQTFPDRTDLLIMLIGGVILPWLFEKLEQWWKG